jgi:hypothetical protein
MPNFLDTSKADFTSISRTKTIEQIILDNSDSTVDLDPEEQETNTGSKRKSRTNDMGGADKTQRSNNGRISRRGNAKSPSVHSTSEFMGTSESQKAVSHRVQLAAYALEMLSYSIGVHHAVNLLIIGTSPYPVDIFQSLTLDR